MMKIPWHIIGGVAVGIIAGFIILRVFRPGSIEEPVESPGTEEPAPGDTGGGTYA